MAKKNLVKNRKVISAMCIGISAMMAMTPITAHAEEGGLGEEPKESEEQTQKETEITVDLSGSEEISGSATVNQDTSGNIITDVEIAGTQLEISEENITQSDSETKSDGTNTVVTDSAVATIKDSSTSADEETNTTTTTTDVTIETNIKNSTANNINEYDNFSTEESEGSEVVGSTVTDVKVTVVETTVTVSDEYDQPVSDEVLKLIENKLSDGTGKLSKDEDGNQFITIVSEDGSEKTYRYSVSESLIQSKVTDPEIHKLVEEELRKEKPSVRTGDDGKTYVRVTTLNENNKEITVEYEYTVSETVDQSTENGKAIMDGLKEASKNVKDEDKDIVTDSEENNGKTTTTETMFITYNDKVYTYSVTESVITHNNTPVKNESDLFKQIEGMVKDSNSENVIDNADGTKTVTIDGEEYVYTPEKSNTVTLDKTIEDDANVIMQIRACIANNGATEGTTVVDKGNGEYLVKLSTDGPLYTYKVVSETSTVTDSSLIDSIREAAKKVQNPEVVDGYTIVEIDGFKYGYKAESEQVADYVAFLQEYSGYNMVSLGDMDKGGAHINGGIICLGTLSSTGNIIDNNRNQDAESSVGTVSKINKIDDSCNVGGIRLANINNDKDNGVSGGQSNLKGLIDNNNANDETHGVFLVDLCEKSAESIKQSIVDTYNTILSKFGEAKEFVQNGITFKLIGSEDTGKKTEEGVPILSDSLNGCDGSATKQELHDSSVSHAYYENVNVVYVVKDVAELFTQQLKSIVLAPFTNVFVGGGESAGTIIGGTVVNNTGTQTHTGKMTPNPTSSEEAVLYSDNEFASYSRKDADASIHYDWEETEYVYEASSRQVISHLVESVTDAWEQLVTRTETKRELSGTKVTYLYGTKTPETPPETPPTPPETPPTTPETPPTTPETPPTTPETPPTTPETPPTTPDTPDDGGDVLGARRGTSEVLGASRTTDPAVLGARRTKAVLGARRTPKTGDAATMASMLGLMLGSSTLAGTWFSFRKKRKDQDEEQE